MSDSKVVQFSDKRREKQEQLKRDYERVLFKRILGCYTFIEKLGLKSVEIMDISKSGCSFRWPTTEGCFNADEEIDFRFYFSQATYLPMKLTVKRVTEVTENGVAYWNHGCSFDTALSTYPALEKMVDFIQAYSLTAKEDKGEAQIFYL
jgi:hypothetical protein